jgi:hypothetical protein
MFTHVYMFRLRAHVSISHMEVARRESLNQLSIKELREKCK